MNRVQLVKMVGLAAHGLSTESPVSRHANMLALDSTTAQEMPNVAKFAKALYALHQANCLKDPKCRPAVGMFVRQATESPHWHLTTHFRSKRAAAKIAKVTFRSPENYHG